MINNNNDNIDESEIIVRGSEDGYEKLMGTVIENNKKLGDILVGNATKIEKLSEQYNASAQAIANFNKEVRESLRLSGKEIKAPTFTEPKYKPNTSHSGTSGNSEKKEAKEKIEELKKEIKRRVDMPDSDIEIERLKDKYDGKKDGLLNESEYFNKYKADTFNMQKELLDKKQSQGFMGVLGGMISKGEFKPLKLLSTSIGSLAIPIGLAVSMIKTLNNALQYAQRAGNEYNKVQRDINQAYIALGDFDIDSTNLNKTTVAKDAAKEARNETFSGGAELLNSMSIGMNALATGFWKLLDIPNDILTSIADDLNDEPAKKLSYSAELLSVAAKEVSKAGTATEKAALQLASAFASDLISQGFGEQTSTNIAIFTEKIASQISQMTDVKFETVYKDLMGGITGGGNNASKYGLQLGDDYLYGWLNKEKGINVSAGMLNKPHESAYRMEYAQWQQDIMLGMRSGKLDSDTLINLNSEFRNLGEVVNDTANSFSAFDKLAIVNNAKVYGTPTYDGKQVQSDYIKVVLGNDTKEIKLTMEEFIDAAGGLKGLDGAEIGQIINKYGLDAWYEFIKRVEDDQLKDKLTELTNIQIKDIIDNGTKKEIKDLYDDLDALSKKYRELETYRKAAFKELPRNEQPQELNKNKVGLVLPDYPYLKDARGSLGMKSLKSESEFGGGGISAGGRTHSGGGRSFGNTEKTVVNVNVGNAYGMDDFQDKVENAVIKGEKESALISGILK